MSGVIEMAQILNLNISHPEISSNQAEPETSTESIRTLKTHVIQLRYQNGNYQLIQGEQIIPLHDDQLLTLGDLIINIQQKESAGIEMHEETQPAIPITDYHIPSLFENSLATEVEHRIDTPLEFEATHSNIAQDDPLAFLYAAQSTLKSQNTYPAYPDKTQKPAPLSLLNQHFQAPIAVMDDICERPLQTITTHSQQEQKNILKAIKNLLPETKKKPASQILRFKNPIIIKA